MNMSNHFNLSFDNCFQKSTKGYWYSVLKSFANFQFLVSVFFHKNCSCKRALQFLDYLKKNFRQFMPETWKTGTWTFAYLNKLRRILYKVYSREFLMQISSLYNVLDCNLALKGLLRRRVFKNSSWLNVNEGNWILDAVGWDI